MDLQTRKLNLIGYLIDIQDENIFSEIESTILEKTKHKMEQNLVRFTQEQLENRAEEANQDYLSGRTKSQDQLESESKSW
jgi:hypothetical protein